MTRKTIDTYCLEKYTKAELESKIRSFTRLLRGYELWGRYVETDGLYQIEWEGETYHYYDVLDGLSELPPRQKQAVELVCLRDMTEIQAARTMGFEKWSTQVNQYRKSGIMKMLAYTELKGEQTRMHRMKLILAPRLKEIGYTGFPDVSYELTDEKGKILHPDFVNLSTRKVVEVWGDFCDRKRKPEKVTESYKAAGWDLEVMLLSTIEE